MPVETKAFKCVFKCGYVAIGEKWTAKHELNCKKNPDKKGCLTCRNFIPPFVGEEMPECEVDYMLAPTIKNFRGLRYNCKHWKEWKEFE